MMHKSALYAAHRAGAGASNVTLFPVGQQAQGNVGTLAVVTAGNITFSLVGRQATGQRGNLSVAVAGNITVPLIGRSGTMQRGNLVVTPTSNVNVLLLGVLGQGRVGTSHPVVPAGAIVVQVSGRSATAGIGILSGEIFAIDWKKQDIHITGWAKETKASGG